MRPYALSGLPAEGVRGGGGGAVPCPANEPPEHIPRAEDREPGPIRTLTRRYPLRRLRGRRITVWIGVTGGDGGVASHYLAMLSAFFSIRRPRSLRRGSRRVRVQRSPESFSSLSPRAVNGVGD